MPRAATALLATVAALVPALALSSATAPASAASAPAAVSFDLGQPGVPVPADFLGLSFEVKSLRQIGSLATQGNLANYLRSLGSGLLRFGGVTADTQVAWAGTGALPEWATTGLRPGDFDGVAALTQETGWRLLLTLNFAHYDPQAAAAEAAEAHSALGDSLAALSFGNEPDAYMPEQLRPDPWGFSPYQQQLGDLRGALGPSEATLPLAGPDAASGRSHLGWVQAEAQDVQPALLTDHFYPLSWCAGSVPAISDLLSPGVKGAETRRLTILADLSGSVGIPLRIDETNSVSCGGEPGVSNTFGSALWATDFIARAMSAGVAGINFHSNLANPTGYSPLAAATPDALASGQLQAQPEWYALLLARQLLGTDPLVTTLRNGGSGLSAQAFLVRGGEVRLVLVDERPTGSRQRSVMVSLPPRLAGATVTRLTAPRLSSTAGVTLAGSAVSADGTWSPGPAGALIPRRRGAVAVPMPPASAALVTFYPRT